MRGQFGGEVAALLVLFCFLAGACGGSHEKPPFLRAALESYPGNLDPRLATDAYAYDVIETLYNGLVKPSAAGGYEPDLAEKIEPETPLRWRILLREGVRFHHGKILSASDVLCTYRSILDPGLGSPAKASFEALEGIEILGERELRLRLVRPAAAFFETITLPILPCDLLRSGHDFSEKPVGTGFLRFVEARSPLYIQLERFSEYFRGETSIPGVRFVHIPDATTRVLSLLRGEIDLSVNNVSPAYVERLGREKHLRIATSPGTNFTYVGFNLRDPVLKGIRVRRAIAHAIHREEIVKYRLKGLADLADALFPAGHWAHASGVRRYEYDPALAEKLLDEAGYPRPADGGPRLSLSYKTSQNKDRLRMIEVIRRRLEEVGVHIEIQPYEFGTFLEQIKRGDFQLYSLTWVGVSDPDFYYDVFHSAQIPENGGRNRGRYSNPRADTLLEAGRAELDPARRATIYREFQGLLAEDLPCLPLWHERNVAVMGERVEGFELNPLASYRALEKNRLREEPR
ncbi:MAG: ABC transporter substrate-binding protein [Bdellovibrionota bacterium]